MKQSANPLKSNNAMKLRLTALSRVPEPLCFMVGGGSQHLSIVVAVLSQKGIRSRGQTVSLLLAALTELFLLRAECARAKARLATFEDLHRKSADFLRTTSENSNWPSSEMSSPIMMRDRRLLESINSVLDPAGEEKPLQNRKKAEKDAGGTSGREKAGGSAQPRKATIRARPRRSARLTRPKTYTPGNAPATIAANSSGPGSIPSSRCSSWRSGGL